MQITVGTIRVMSFKAEQLSHAVMMPGKLYLATKEGVCCAEADIVSLFVGVCGPLHASRAHNHIVQPTLLKFHLSAPLLDQDAPEQVQDSCTAISHILTMYLTAEVQNS